MPNAFTGTGAVAWDQTAFNRYLYFAFREMNTYDNLADVKPTAQTTPGAHVTFFLANDLTPVSTALDESTDVDAVALSDTTVTVDLFEQGNAVIDTALLQLTSMIPVDPTIANILGENAAKSMDTIVRDVLKAGTNVNYSPDTALSSVRPNARNKVTPTSTLSSADYRLAFNRLRRGTVPMRNGLYDAVTHPDTLYDLRVETGGLGWMALHTYTDSGVSDIYNGAGYFGVYEGFRTMQTIFSPLFVDGGSSPATTDVYATLFMGGQALAKGYANSNGYGENPITVKGPVTDKLERLQPWGWKHFVGYKIFRQQALYRVESGSSVGVNS